MRLAGVGERSKGVGGDLVKSGPMQTGPWRSTTELTRAGRATALTRHPTDSHSALSRHLGSHTQSPGLPTSPNCWWMRRSSWNSRRAARLGWVIATQPLPMPRCCSCPSRRSHRKRVWRCADHRRDRASAAARWSRRQRWTHPDSVGSWWSRLYGVALSRTLLGSPC